MLTVHLGLPKTATTLLQYRVFGKQDTIRFVHDPRDEDPDALERLLRRHQRAPAHRLEELEHRIAVALPEGETLVSNENISLFATELWAGNGPSADRMAERLGRLRAGCEGVRAIFGIRRQDQWLASMYAQSVRSLPTPFCQADFEARVEALCRSRLRGASSLLDYRAVYAHLVEQLGRDNVLVLASEDVATRPADVLRSLDRFLGVATFEAAHRAGRLDLGPVNVLSGGQNQWRVKGYDGTLKLSDELAWQVLDRFAPSNAGLAEATGIDLGEHGYV